MENNNFSISEVVGLGWETTKNNFWLLVGVTLFLIVAGGALNLMAERTPKRAAGLSFLFSFSGFVLSMLLALGQLKIVLKLAYGEEASFKDLFSCTHLLLRYIGASLLYGVIVAVGLFLFIVPGVLWALKFFFYSYFIVDEEAGIIGSFKKSAALTKGSRWNLLFLFLVIGGINMLGAFLFGVGLLVTTPLSYLIAAFTYRRLSTRKEIDEGA